MDNGYKAHPSKFNSKQGILFGASCVAALVILVVAPEWVWVAFPFICTYFVKMLDWI
jgi:hypothetical protein